MDIVIFFLVIACGVFENKALYITTLIMGAIELAGGIYLKFAGFAGTVPEVVGLLGIIVPIVILSQKHEDAKVN